MKLFGRKEKRSVELQDGVKLTDPILVEWLQSRSKPMLLSTVYRCVDLISDAISVLPLETFSLDPEGFKTPQINTRLYQTLNVEPYEDMSRFVFFKTLTASALLKGNAYAYIERDAKGEPEQLIYIPSECVSIEWVRDMKGVERKRYRISGYRKMSFGGLIEPQDMIHVLNFSYDGITGLSTLAHARQTLEIATYSESHAASFFKSGGSLSGILKFEGKLNKKQKDEIYEDWYRRTDPVTGRLNGIVVLSGDQSYSPITISPKDSQLLESRQHSVIDICRFFSVSPVKAFDLSKSSYSTIEATQLEFLTGTLQPIITKIELELNRKLFYKKDWGKKRVEFNTSAILRADKTAQSEYWNKLFQIGVVSPNEVRRDLNLGRVDGGDKKFVPVNMQTLDNAVVTKISKENDVKQKNG